MGTRSLTSVYDTTWSDEPRHKMTFYRHWDGYPEAHGADIAKFLDGVILGNGIPHPKPKKFANGTGRLATQLLCFINSEGHDPDLVSEGAIMGQQYHYVITGHANNGTIDVKIYDGPMTAFGCGGEDCTNVIFEGSADEYQTWIKAAPDGAG